MANGFDAQAIFQQMFAPETDRMALFGSLEAEQQAEVWALIQNHEAEQEAAREAVENDPEFQAEKAALQARARAAEERARPLNDAIRNADPADGREEPVEKWLRMNREEEAFEDVVNVRGTVGTPDLPWAQARYNNIKELRDAGILKPPLQGVVRLARIQCQDEIDLALTVFADIDLSDPLGEFTLRWQLGYSGYTYIQNPDRFTPGAPGVLPGPYQGRSRATGIRDDKTYSTLAEVFAKIEQEFSLDLTPMGGAIPERPAEPQPEPTGITTIWRPAFRENALYRHLRR